MKSKDTGLVGGRHVGIPVASMAKAKAFYVDLLGFVPKVDQIEEGEFISTITGFKQTRIRVLKAICPKDGWMVELLEYLQDPESALSPLSLKAIGHSHIALTVGDIDATFQRLSSEGIEFISAPQTSPSGYARVCFCKDPDGNYVELVQVLDGSHSKAEQSSTPLP